MKPVFLGITITCKNLKNFREPRARFTDGEAIRTRLLNRILLFLEHQARAVNLEI